MLGSITQHPLEQLRYDIDYRDWLDADGPELLSGITVVVEPATISPLQAVASISSDQLWVHITLYGGLDEQDYTVSFRASTTYNQKDYDCLAVAIRSTC